VVRDLSGPQRDQLLGVLLAARDKGFLGPGPVEAHLDHSRAFVLAWSSVSSAPPATVLDLGSGGGVPGLVLALSWPESSIVLLDGGVRRTEFLDSAVASLGLEAQVHVVTARAEDAGHGPLRETLDLVTARGFAAAAVTAECAAPLVHAHGYVIVAEPPTPTASRWPAQPLAQLGLRLSHRLNEPFHVQVLERYGPVASRFPRRVGVPAKRPLWDERRGDSPPAAPTS
jgi:16S rRNA (guanine527-N7)-methyltransferase